MSPLQNSPNDIKNPTNEELPVLQIPIVIGSSSDEEETNLILDGYVPLSQEPPEQEMNNDTSSDENIDYSSLSGLMSALENNGPMQVDVEESQSSSPQLQKEHQQGQNSLYVTLNPNLDYSSHYGTTSLQSNQIDNQNHTIEASSRHQRIQAVERLEVWRDRDTKRSIELDAEKEMQIKAAMASFSLPPSSVPDWAKDISEDQLISQIMERIPKNQNNTIP